MDEQVYDYIIVGAGSAGCVLANRLSARPEARVLLLEAGGGDSNPFIHMPAGLAQLVNQPHVNWHYYTEPEPELNGRRLLLATRPGARRQQFHQCDVLHARPSARL